MRARAGAWPTAFTGTWSLPSLLRRLAGVAAAEAGTERVLLRALEACLVVPKPGVLLPCSHDEIWQQILSTLLRHPAKVL